MTREPQVLRKEKVFIGKFGQNYIYDNFNIIVSNEEGYKFVTEFIGGLMHSVCLADRFTPTRKVTKTGDLALRTLPIEGVGDITLYKTKNKFSVRFAIYPTFNAKIGEVVSNHFDSYLESDKPYIDILLGL